MVFWKFFSYAISVHFVLRIATVFFSRNVFRREKEDGAITREFEFLSVVDASKKMNAPISEIEFASSLVNFGGGALLASFWLESIGYSPLSLLGESCWSSGWYWVPEKLCGRYGSFF